MSNEDDNYYANLIHNFENSQQETQWETVCKKKSKDKNDLREKTVNIPEPKIKVVETDSSKKKHRKRNRKSKNNSLSNLITPLNSTTPINLTTPSNSETPSNSMSPVTETVLVTEIETVLVTEIENKLVLKNVESPENHNFNDLIMMIVTDTDKIIALLSDCSNLEEETQKILKIKLYINTVFTKGVFSINFPNELDENDVSLCMEIISFVSKETSLTPSEIPVGNFQPIVQESNQENTPKYQAPPLKYQSQPQQYQAAHQQYQVPYQQYQVPQQYQAPNQQYQAPPQQYQAPNQQYQAPNQQYQAPNQQYIVPPQSYQMPYNQYEAPPSPDNIQKFYVPPYKRQNNLPIQEIQQFKDYEENKVPFGLFFGPDSIWNPK